MPGYGIKHCGNYTISLDVLPSITWRFRNDRAINLKMAERAMGFSGSESNRSTGIHNYGHWRKQPLSLYPS
ncbi:MAG: hypothetical protein BWY09_03156 [Candidatus Hydrogenedentes bacterium ADurb.Bin179]|nr:MAG: hypothetical protein BWY09_03156 [Candidatus Hydrogenedentes bacterium ADurb.Bin179]